MEKAFELVTYIFSMSAIRYFVIAGIPFLIFYVLFAPKLKRFKIQERFAKRKDFIREILHSTQATLVFSVLTFIVLFTPFREYTLVYDNLNEFPLWYLGVSVVLSLVIHDTYFYWMHRLLHNKKLYKLAHLLHHRSVSPSPWTSYSFHLFESVTEGLVLIVIVMILPMHPLGVLLFTVVAFIINVYGHLGYEVAPKQFRNTILFEFFNTSVHHNMHHSRFNWNYGVYFRVWDRLMGTEHPDYVKEYDRLQAKRFGETKEKDTASAAA